MKTELPCVITALVINMLCIIQSNAASIATPNDISNSVISNYRVQPIESSTETGLQLIKYLGFVQKDGLIGNETVTVELLPNDDFALERCQPKAMMYELLNFQIQLYLSIEKTSFRTDFLPVCERVEKCVGSMHSMASRSENFQERLFSPILLVLKQVINLACNLERRNSKMNVNTIVDTTKTVYNNVMMIKNLMKTLVDVGLFAQ